MSKTEATEKSEVEKKENKAKPVINVIIGGVAGGASCAARLRRLSEDCEIKMFERGPYVSFATCGLPYYVGDVIKEEKKLLVATAAMFKKRFNIDVLLNHNITSIDRKNKIVKGKNAKGEFEQKYDNLILAVGAKPIKPKQIPGLDLDGVFTVRTIEDSELIRKYISKLEAANKNKKIRSVIVGGGFIGLEMAENLVNRKTECTIIDGLPQVMGIVDKEMSIPFNYVLEKNGVKLLLNELLDKITTEKNCKIVHTKTGKKCEADLVILGLGVLPENDLAKAAGLELGVRGSVKVNENMQTSDKNIFCVGDVVETYNHITKEKLNLTLAGPAQQQARIVANYITKKSNDVLFRGVQGSSVCEIFGEIIASTGLTEKMIRMSKDKELIENMVCIYAHPGHHADFYPNAKKVHLKVIFNKKDGRILGAQCCGQAGVTKFIDTISAFIQMKGTIGDLAHFELCYSPSQGSARGPINDIGQIGMNAKSGLIKVLDWNDLYNKNVLVLDVRTKNEIEQSKLDDKVNWINIPVDEIRDRYSELNKYKKDMTIAVLCKVGKRAYIATRILEQKGFSVKLASGGITTYHMIQGSYDYKK